MASWIYVSDDENVLTVVENALKEHGYSVKAISSDKAPDHLHADIALLCEKPMKTNRLTLGDLTMDLDSVTAYTRDGVAIHFTPIEFSMLSFLLQNAHRAVSRSELLSVVWGYTSDNNTRVADDTAKRLRRKLVNTTVALETVWNFGFRVREK